MTPGTPLQIIRDITNLLEAKGVLLPDGNFDQTKFHTVEECMIFAIGVENSLKSHGLSVPPKVDKILAILPLLAGILQ